MKTRFAKLSNDDQETIFEMISQLDHTDLVQFYCDHMKPKEIANLLKMIHEGDKS